MFGPFQPFFSQCLPDIRRLRSALNRLIQFRSTFYPQTPLVVQGGGECHCLREANLQHQEYFGHPRGNVIFFFELPCQKQKNNYPTSRRFLSCVAFSVNEVVHVACQSRVWFVLYVPAFSCFQKIEQAGSWDPMMRKEECAQNVE